VNLARLPSRRARSWVIGLLLVAGALGAARLQPGGAQLARPGPPDLEAVVPQRFADWRAEPKVDRLADNPELTAKVEATYARTLERVYADEDGRRIMLSIAYGSNQLGDSLQAHRPEYCYRAQGFDIGSGRDDILQTAHGGVPVRRLLARYAKRSEPITYWLTVGEHTALPGLTRKLQQLRYGLAGDVPDGLLIRISSLDRDASAAYGLHDRFIRELLAALPAAERVRFGGRALGDTGISQSFSLSTQPLASRQFQLNSAEASQR